MSNITKFLLGFFLLLIVVISGELFYFYFINQNQIPSSSISPTASVESPQTNITNPVDQIISMFNIVRKKMAAHGILKYSHLTDQYETKIIAIDSKGGTNNIGGKTYNYKIALTIDIGGNETTTFHLNENDLSHYKITQLISGKESTINFGDLKAGDKVLITITIDTMKDLNDNTISASIVKQ